MLLLPLSWLYGLIMRVRNWLYKAEILQSKTYDIPVINVGNITVGGTGKTPHVEYVARILQEKYTVALLSRGYKRKTRGFVLAGENATAKMIGDEPFQMKQNLGEKIIVAVDANRRRGIKKLLKLRPEIDVILLDDAYQHRRVTPGLNILLIDYNRPIYRDRLLPAGNLRESVSEKKRADIIIFSKCPDNITPIDIRIATTDLKALPYQSLFFSTYRYGGLQHIAENDKIISLSDLNSYNVLLVTGIAQPQALKSYLETQTANLRAIHYDDHHHFSQSDIKNIEKNFSAQPKSLIITTEKDAARLKSHLADFSEECRSKIYVLPIEVDFLQDKKAQFDKKILDFVKRG
jgi:tetraacyldisaccharide 4'-kinase